MNTQILLSGRSCGSQLALFSPTAEGYASVHALRAASPKSGGKRPGDSKKTAIAWRPVTLTDMTSEELARAPGTFQELCRVTSVEEAISMCEQFGGLKLRIPPPEDGSRWRNSGWRKRFKELLSPASYENLLREMGRSGSDFIFPSLDRLKKQRRNQRIREVVDLLLSEKKPYLKTLQTIAVAEGIHMSTIYKILKQSN
jgi:hypothetical protein